MEMLDDTSYVCTLSKKTLCKAMKELNEDPLTRMAAVKDLREWIQQQNHITCDTDCRMLLRFLRISKFSQLCARQQLERYLQALKSMPEWWGNIDTYCPKLLALLKTGCLTDLGIDDDGRVNFLLTIGRVDPGSSLYDENDLVRLVMAALYCQMYNEEQQVHGVVFLFDNSGYTPEHQRFLCMDMLRRGSRMFQSTFPGRWKCFHYYNAGTVFENMYAVVKPLLKKKIRERVMFHRSIKHLHKHIPYRILPKELLPDAEDVAASINPTMQQLNDKLFEILTSSPMREQILYLTNNQKFTIDLSRKVKSDETQTQFYRKLMPD